MAEGSNRPLPPHFSTAIRKCLRDYLEKTDRTVRRLDGRKAEDPDEVSIEDLRARGKQQRQTIEALQAEVQELRSRLDQVEARMGPSGPPKGEGR